MRLFQIVTFSELQLRVRVWVRVSKKDDGLEGAVRVVPTAHTAVDACVGGVRAAGVSVAVHGPERGDGGAAGGA